MAFREVPVFEVREVLRLWLLGHGLRAIERLARVVGFPRNRGGFLMVGGSLIRWHFDTTGVARGREKRSDRPVSCGPLLSGLVGGSLFEDLFVGDGGHHLTGAVAAPVVVVVDEGGDLPSGLVLGGEVPA